MIEARSSSRHNTFVSFSGIDGAGKSTQIENLQDWLAAAGFRVRVMAFWDTVAVLGRIRELSSHTLFQSETGIGSPDKPVNRRDKNVHPWYMAPVRCVLCFVDAINLRRILCNALANDEFDVVIFDRYLYDQLATLWLHGPLSRIFVKLLVKVLPHPDVAYLLDANPAEARKRKPEYPLEFLNRYRAAYLGLSGLAQMAVIPPGPASEVARVVIEEFLKKLPPTRVEAFSGRPAWNEKIGMNVGSSLS